MSLFQCEIEISVFKIEKPVFKIEISILALEKYLPKIEIFIFKF